ncbi:polyprenyl synthetase family protein [Ancrocorticia populi]|uniref:polyprenyl synthetase family protein n=1 Tax=Ancrocorticia populi TaxID=2175228 RepID=UPI003F92E746
MSISDNLGALGDRLSTRMERVESMLHDKVTMGDLQIDPTTSHLAKAGGKRLRPALVFLTSELGPDPEAQAVYDSAVAVELTHLASLYHDDVMDEAPMRRGVESAQLAFGNTVAILAGDILFSRASTIVAGLGPRSVELHATMFERLCTGQLHETIGLAAGENPREHYISVLADKTGSLIAASARYGVLSSGGSEELAETVAQYGECVGVAFQLADDVIDIMSEGDATGKTPGTDLREGVDTMPTLLLKEQAEAGTLDDLGREILDLLANSDLAVDENLAEVVNMLRRHSVLDQTQELAKEWMDKGLQSLKDVPEGPVRDSLVQYAEYSINRSA